VSDDVLIRVEGVSKKFCRSLKKSLWYGVKDTVADLVGRGSYSSLRPDEFWAVNDVSFELKRGESLGLIGRNGAGKTTVLKLLNGLIKPDKGRIEMRGSIGALIALGAGFNPILTGRENIYVTASVLGLTKRETDEKINDIVQFAEVGEFLDSPVQSYSSGMAIRLGFAVATAVRPDVLLLDEILAVGDASFRAKCFNVLAEFQRQGTAFILVAHDMRTIARHSQRALYLRNGCTKHLGDTADAIAQLLKDGKSSGTAHHLMDWSKACGSGKIRLVGARFLNSKNDQITWINAGDSVILVVEYEQLAPITSVVLDIAIRENDIILYHGTRE